MYVHIPTRNSATVVLTYTYLFAIIRCDTRYLVLGCGIICCYGDISGQLSLQIAHSPQEAGIQYLRPAGA